MTRMVALGALADSRTRRVRVTRSTARARGFTLLEIMVVIVIIGLLAAGALISLGSTGKDRELEQERDRLAALMSYTRERGAMLTLEYGIRCGLHGYRFVYYDNRTSRWLPEVVDDTLKLRKLPSGLHIALQIEGHDLVLDDKALQYDAKAAMLAAYGSSSSSSSGGLGTLFGGASSGGFNSNALNSGSFRPSSSGGIAGSSASGLGGQSADNTPQVMLFSNGDTNSFVMTLVRDATQRSTTLKSNEDGPVQVGDVTEPAP